MSSVTALLMKFFGFQCGTFSISPESIFLHLGIIRIEITNSAFIRGSKQSIPSDMKVPTWCVSGEPGDLLYCQFSKNELKEKKNLSS